MRDVTDRSPTPPCETLFTRFSHFPVEIRLLVWKHCVPKRRLVHLELQPKCPFEDQERDEDGNRLDSTFVNHLGNKVSNQPYKILESSSSPLRHVLAVNREAREALLPLFRLAIPLDSNTGRLLRLNPDTDIVSLKAPDRWDPYIWFFLSDAMAYDPLGQGITNLCLPTISEQPPFLSLIVGRGDVQLYDCVHAVFTRSLKALYVCVIPSLVDLPRPDQGSWHDAERDETDEQASPAWAMRDVNPRRLVKMWRAQILHLVAARFGMRPVLDIDIYLIDPLYGISTDQYRSEDDLGSSLMQSLQSRWAKLYERSDARTSGAWDLTPLAKGGLTGVSGLLLIGPLGLVKNGGTIPFHKIKATEGAGGVVQSSKPLLDLNSANKELLLLDGGGCQW